MLDFIGFLVYSGVIFAGFAFLGLLFEPDVPKKPSYMDYPFNKV